MEKTLTFRTLHADDGSNQKSKPAASATSPLAPTRSIPSYLYTHLNFYRLHVLAFTFVPFVASGIFYGSNGEIAISYMDSVFMCYSAMTVTGLATINISSCTGWQQTMLFLLMIMGDLTVVSWIMVLVRIHYFRVRCKALITAHAIKRKIRRVSTYAKLPSDQDLSDSTAPLQSKLVETRESDGYHSAAGAYTGISTASKQIKQGTDYLARKSSKQSGSGRNYYHTPESMGSFPSPISVFRQLYCKLFPKHSSQLSRSLTRSFTMNRSNAIMSQSDTAWLNFDGLKVSRNSRFHLNRLTQPQIEEVGGIEYRALLALAWIVASYFVASIILSILLTAPYLDATSKYDSVFQAQARFVPMSWFVTFQSVSLYTGGGLSLCDQGMIPFQQDWYLGVVWGILIAAGNMGLPIFLRTLVSSIFKLTPKMSDLHQTLSFLLDHPRRCYLYLFPSHQTWFLLLFFVSLSAFEWASFEILNIGLNLGLSASAKALTGWFQSISTRASGVAIVNLSTVAPSLQFLFVVCMYIAIYPISMTLRATNVYEERGLGIYDEDSDSDDEEPTNLKGSRREVFGKYLMWHVRRQLSMEIWWPIVGIWLIAIIERTQLLNTDDLAWFTLFRVIFDSVSAFAVGLSLGLPYDNYSFCGSFRKLSKLVIIVLMVRGRLRGLPVAIDRSILLPVDKRKVQANRLEMNRTRTQEQNLDEMT